MLNCGPFTAEVHDETLLSTCFRYTDSLFHFPEPGEEARKYLGGGWLTGIPNGKGLRLWMPSKSVLRDLYNREFRLKLYSVKTECVINDDTQCAFMASEATVVKEYSFDEAIAEIFKNRDAIYLGTDHLIPDEEDDDEFDLPPLRL